jgi:hypothetical protein
MKRSEVLRWLQDHGGQADYEVETKIESNANRTSRTDPETISVKYVTWTAKDGQKLSVRDTGQRSQPSGPDPGMPGGTGVEAEPVYEVVGSDTTPGREDTRTPEAKRNEEKLDAQRRKNEEQTGNWETDADRVKREREEYERARQVAADERRNELERERIEIAREAERRAGRGEERAGRAEERAITTAEREAEIAGRRITLEEDKYNFERERANRPEIISRPTSEDKSIAVFNPASGTVEAQANPLYDEAKVEAKRKQEELALAIQQNKMSADQAAAEYTRWFKQTVEVPFLRAAEQRAQASERRAALEAEERRRQFQATHELETAKYGQAAAGQMLNAEMELNPYRVGPAFGEQMGSAITSLAGGGKMDANASAGINFTADAFEYTKPNLEKIARKATKAALKHLTKYTPSDEEYATADYSGINMPSNESMGTAPPAPSFLDTYSMFQNIVKPAP